MNIYFASSAELYREHRRTQSRRKKKKIAAELQRRHDEANIPPGYERDRWWVYVKTAWTVTPFGRGCFEDIYHPVHRFNFELELP